MAEADRAIAIDRDWRRQVRRAYYLRATDFDTDRAYNDYLEEVEDLVERLVCEDTRPAARQQLDSLRSTWAAQTARNLAQHDTERRGREEAIEQERAAALQAAQERREAEQRAAEAVARKREALQDRISAGTTSATMARADLRAHAAEAAAEAAEASSTQRAPAAAAAAAQPSYMPSAPAQPSAAHAQPAMVQPLDAAAAAAREANAPAFMVSSIKAEAEAYEADPGLMSKVCAAGGYDREIWRERYRQEALSMANLTL